MSLSDDLRASADVPLAFAAALEHELGDDVLLTVGQPRDSATDVVGDEPVRVVVGHFEANAQAGLVALVALNPFAETIERIASDEILLTSAAPPVEAGVRALGSFIGSELEIVGVDETDVATLFDDIAAGDVVAYPILDGTDAVACLVIAVTSVAATNGAATPARAADARDAVMPPQNNFVLADVEMGVTAELGRCRMSVRELLSITPGAVIDLDRAAGAPVDVLVNGTLIARGEVVVIDEEFGIRISEIVPQGTTVH